MTVFRMPAIGFLSGLVVRLFVLSLVLVGVKTIVIIGFFRIRILFSFVEHGNVGGQCRRRGHPEANRLGIAGGTAGSPHWPVRTPATLSLRPTRIVPRLVLTVREVIFFQDFISFINGLVII